MSPKSIIKGLGKVQTGVVNTLAGLACAFALAVFLIIIYDVTIRTIGITPPPWASVFAEYSLLFFAMAAAPYLVRNRGHVFVEAFTSKLPGPLRRRLEQVVYIACIGVCLMFAFVALFISWEAYGRGDLDMRAISVPLWVQTAPLPFGFFLMAIEFARFLFGPESMYSRGDSPPEEV